MTDLPDVMAPAAAAPIHQIGGDGGFLPAIATLSGQLPAGQNPSPQDFLVLAPGERADVVIDFSSSAGSTIYLSNHAQETQPLGNGGDAATVADGSALVMQFVVAAAPVAPALAVATLDAQLLAVRPVPAAASFDAQLPAVPTRAFVVKEFGPLPLNPWEATKDEVPPAGVSARRGWNAITFQNDLSQPDTPGALWGGTVAAPLPAPPLQVASVPNGGPALDAQDLSPATRHRIGGGVELWAYVNISVDIHPLHIHLAQMRVYGRTPVPAAPLPAVLVPPQPGTYTAPDPNEAGWKDTIRANPGEITWVLVSFDDGGDSTLDYSGHFVWHCHLLEHEDMGMMRALEVFR
jgi:FtsP/CotA-like multicopper oxidase with cupredoxin domain